VDDPLVQALVADPLHLCGQALSHGQALSLPFTPSPTNSVLPLFHLLCGRFYFNIGDKSAKTHQIAFLLILLKMGI